MPIELNSTIKKSTNWTFGQMGLNKVFSNDFYTAVLVTLIIVAILFVLDFNRRNSTWSICKTVFYIYVASFIMLFFHRSKLRDEYKKENSDNNTSQFINDLNKQESNNIVFGGVPVKPMMGDNINTEVNTGVDDVDIIEEVPSVENEKQTINPNGGDNSENLFKLYGV